MIKRIAVVGPITLAPLIHLLDIDESKYYKDYSDLGLGGSQITQLVEELVRRGYNVLACSAERKIKEPVLLRGALLTVLFVPYQKPFKRLLSIYSLERRIIANTIKDFMPEIVHAHWTYEFALATIDTKFPHLITVHDHPLQVIRDMSDKVYRFYRLLIHFLVVYKGKAFTANSPITSMMIPKKKLRAIVPNGIKTEFIRYSVDRKKSFEQIMICSIGSADKSKNIRSVIDAVINIKKYGYPISLQLIGPGLGSGSVLNKYVKSIGAADIIIFLGVVSHNEAISLIATSDLYVHPSKLESFGSPVVEAMIVGTPCIVPKVGQGPEWILENGRYGTIANGADPKDFEHAIISYLSDPLPSNLKAALAIQHAEHEYSIAIVTERYLNLYKEIVAEQRYD